MISSTRPDRPKRYASLPVSVTALRRCAVLARIPRVPKIVQESARADCEVGADLARRLRLPEGVRRAVLCAFERFDGKGAPAGLAGDDVSEAARFAAVGFAAVMFDAIGGVEAATAAVARWSGRALDPAIAAIFLAAPGGWWNCPTRTTCGPPLWTASHSLLEYFVITPISTTRSPDSVMPQT